MEGPAVGVAAKLLLVFPEDDLRRHFIIVLIDSGNRKGGDVYKRQHLGRINFLNHAFQFLCLQIAIIRYDQHLMYRRGENIEILSKIKKVFYGGLLNRL